MIYIQQIKSFHGLLLIPKQRIVSLYERYGGDVSNSNSNAIHSSNYFRIPIFRVLILVFVQIFVVFGLLMIQGSLMAIVIPIILNRNAQYQNCEIIRNEVRFLHMLATDKIGASLKVSSLSYESIYHDISLSLHMFNNVLRELRSGNSVKGTVGIDRDPVLADYFYKSTCGVDSQVLNETENLSPDQHLEFLKKQLSCLSIQGLTQQLSLDSLFIAKWPAETAHLISSSPYFMEIIAIDNDENDRGLLQDLL